MLLGLPALFNFGQIAAVRSVTRSLWAAFVRALRMVGVFHQRAAFQQRAEGVRADTSERRSLLELVLRQRWMYVCVLLLGGVNRWVGDRAVGQAALPLPALPLDPSHPLLSLSLALREASPPSLANVSALVCEDGESVTFHDPRQFATLRRHFNMSEAAFVHVLQDVAAFPPMSSNSKGAARRHAGFWRSTCGTYVIKESTKDEVDTLHSLLPAYEEHLRENPRCMIARHCAMFSLKDAEGAEKHYLVLQNVFAGPSLPPSCSAEPPVDGADVVFDLKGSSRGRESLPLRTWGHAAPLQASMWLDKERRQRHAVMDGAPGNCTDAALKPSQLKDNDWRVLALRVPGGQEALTQIERDVAFLARHNLMDYSLLVGVTLRAPPRMAEAAWGGAARRVVRGRKGRRGTAVRHGAAVAWRLPGSAEGPVQSFELGIIDILQVYNARKRAETVAKAVRYGSTATISAVPADAYAQRFTAFMGSSVLPREP